MARTDRLLSLLQLLRQYRHPVTAQILAEQLQVSIRTIYRDIATLQAQGANIEGEAGLGFQLRPGYLLPPLMFTEEEIEALILGAKWVDARTDAKLAQQAKSAIAKIDAILPPLLQEKLSQNSLMIPLDKNQPPPHQIDMSLLRQAMRRQKKIDIQYLDLKEQSSARRLWPFALGFFEQIQVLVGWCELRQAFRHFRTDRIQSLTLTDIGFPQHKQKLLTDWCQQNNIKYVPLFDS